MSKRRKLLTPAEVKQTPLWAMSKRDYERSLDLHVDLKPGAEGRVEQMMGGDVHGMVSGPDVLDPMAWINWAGKRKKGAVGYLFTRDQVGRGNYLKEGAKPHSYAVLTRDGQTFHEAAIEKALAEGKEVPAEVLAEYPHLKPASQPAYKPLKTAKAAESWATKNLGIPVVSYGGNAYLGNAVNTALADLKARGLPMPGMIITSLSPMVGSSIADYSPETDSISFAAADPQWKNAEENKRGAEAAHASGWFSSAHPFGAIHHEMGHKAHVAKLGIKGYRKLDGKGIPPGPLRDEMGKEVSRYALKSAQEFVAEVFAGMLGGKRYEPKVMEWYKNFQGPDLPG